jgi:hypothetical protein
MQTVVDAHDIECGSASELGSSAHDSPPSVDTNVTSSEAFGRICAWYPMARQYLVETHPTDHSETVGAGRNADCAHDAPPSVERRITLPPTARQSAAVTQVALFRVGSPPPPIGCAAHAEPVDRETKIEDGGVPKPAATHGPNVQAIPPSRPGQG